MLQKNLSNNRDELMNNKRDTRRDAWDRDYLPHKEIKVEPPRKGIWRYWCKAMGSRAYDDDKKDDHVHLLMRTPWFVLHIVTCMMIITGNGRLLGWW